ncbi:hypothetical protein [Persicitalea jodogahamensis]|uniref:Uncharacterized protein n=1 Tax=Persicitalea jodogahamensis TaxID=402147 RepID=A0A8J3D8U7_9BACT|nr:hypothetical protein [Persicitalea jodogahamensis]GHB69787.1 hypothetical protein GCM10007390_24260 [Persicitalea jodogahamensis]
MNTARILYEQYKVLPKKVRKELKALIISEDEPEASNSLMAEIEHGLEEVKAMKEGKIPVRTFEDIKRDLRNGE